MDAIEKYKKKQERIKSGKFIEGDISFRHCDFCFSPYVDSTIYTRVRGYLGWACGFCERGLSKKRKDMVYKIAIDADSLVSKALQRFPLETHDIEYAYYDFCQEIGKIKGAIFAGLHDYEKGDSIEAKIILTPRTNFRYRVSSTYKANRPPRSQDRIDLMKLINRRLKDWVEIHKDVEADDVVIWYAKQGWMVSAIDKDVINACPTYCYNYNKYKWIEPTPPYVVEKWYLMQCMMGDSTDGIKGAKGIGEVKAHDIVHNADFPSFANIVPKFDSYEEALMNMRLVRMDQYHGPEKGVILWEPNMEDSLI